MAVATSTLLGRPLWYELMTTDMKAAESFYRDVVGWKTKPFEGAGQPYTMFDRGGDRTVGGVMTKPDEVKAPPFWAMYIGVPQLEEAADKIKKLGGRAHTEVISVPTVGRMQMMMDPQGAALYII
jgi:predicted enzyme related to lactoylglutathione lyase